ncbi:MAG: hypothetical protein K2I75_00255 [Clostridiales bacterium]|nr:hypothetical protein [Clostridiales bacterium]
MDNAVNIALIDSYIKANNLSKTKFCKLCKISVYTFNKIMTDQDFDMINLFRIAKTMGVHICKLLIG